MKRESTLSEYVQDCIETLDSQGSPEERAEGERTRKMFEVIVGDIVSSRETVTDGNVRAGLPRINAELPLALLSEELLKLEPELVRHFLDQHFTRQVVNAVPGYVERTMQLSRLEAERTASKVTNAFLKEAVRTYILGLPQASVALCRAALEQALKDRLGRQLSGDFITFQDLLKDARKWNILDPTAEDMARDVAKAGDEVLHEKPTDLGKAEEVLMEVRGLLQHIYSAEGGF